MNHLYKVDPLLAKNLTRLAIIEEERIITEQTSLLVERLKAQIKYFSKAELEFLQFSLLAIYGLKEDKDDFLESLLHLIDQQLKK